MQTPRDGTDARGRALDRRVSRALTPVARRPPNVVVSPSLQVEAHDPLLGTIVGGRYRVGAILGHGGMGRVYAAKQEGLGREVALKVLLLSRTWAGNPSYMERFVREAESASALNHPNIVAIYDFGVLPDGRPFLAMERLVGETLADLAARHAPLEVGIVADIVRQAASALDAVHSIGVVHRDVKSENLVLTELPDGRRLVKLIDFGLVALAHRNRLTNKGFVVGTPEFVAPEALELDGELPDKRADVYSLAVVAFELLTGGLPFEAEALPALLVAKLRGKSRSLSEVARRPFPAAIEHVIRHGLARRPDERFETAGAFAAAFATAAEVEPSDHADTIRMTTVERTADTRTRETEVDNVWSFAGDSLVIETSALTSLSSQNALARSRSERWFLLGALAIAALLIAIALFVASR